jgi:hypothetical membrane protein
MTDNALKPTAPVIPEATRWLALGAVAGPVLFTLAWFVLGFLSPGFTNFGTVIEPYSPVSQPISGLGLGSTAPFMNTAFVLSGILLMAGVIGVFQTMTASGLPAARWACAALLALSPLGLEIAGIFEGEDPLPHLIGFLLTTGTPVLSFLAAGFLSARDAALAAVRHLATPGQSANAPAGGSLLFDVRSGRDRRWGRSGWANAAHTGRRSPGLVRSHGLAGLPPPVAARPRV